MTTPKEPNKVLVNRDDLNSMIKSLEHASDTFNRLETLAMLIKEKSKDDLTIYHLAETMKNISSDWANMLDVHHDEYQEKYLPKAVGKAA